MPPIEPRPYFAWIALKRLAAKRDRLVPGHLAPGIGDPLADHRLQHAILVGGVAPGEAALDAGMALIGPAVLVGHHAHDLVALHLGLERAADAAIGAGRDDASVRAGRCSMTDFSVERGGRAGLDAGAAGHAFGVEEIFIHAGRDMRGKAAAVDGQGEGALHLLAGAHAARADDALGGIEGEIGIGLVLGLVASSCAAPGETWLSPS